MNRRTFTLRTLGALLAAPLAAMMPERAEAAGPGEIDPETLETLQRDIASFPNRFGSLEEMRRWHHAERIEAMRQLRSQEYRQLLLVVQREEERALKARRLTPH